MENTPPTLYKKTVETRSVSFNLEEVLRLVLEHAAPKLQVSLEAQDLGEFTVEPQYGGYGDMLRLSGFTVTLSKTTEEQIDL
jgi:hypothetical protein